MEHPLISSLSDLTDQQLNDKINELYNKMSTARRINNAQLINQLVLALESYKQEYNKRLEKQQPDSIDFNKSINITRE